MLGLGAVAVSVLAYGWFEAGWLRTRVLELPVDGLPAALDGLRVAHLSDFHFGPVSRGRRAGLRAADWVRSRRPDLVLVTGDLLSRPSGRPALDEALAGLDAIAVLGNHDVAVTRDPFSRAAELEGLPATLLVDESTLLGVRGVPVQVAGVSPRPAGPLPDLDEAASFRILLSHYPRLRTPGYQLVLAGHMHAGQIVVPYPGGKVRLAHLRARLNEGVYRHEGVTLHVSPGLGTTFVPFRFFARPEVTELVLRSRLVEGHSVISPDVLARYAADAAREVKGVHGLVGRNDGVKVTRDEGRVGIELRVALEWGANAGAVGAAVQAHVADCLARMADVRPDAVDVIVDEWHSASPA